VEAGDALADDGAPAAGAGRTPVEAEAEPAAVSAEDSETK
jgi:hypothetical protein